MFDVGFQEIVLISIIALLVIGPERLPSVARTVGLYVGKMQRFVAGVKSDIASELKADELRGLINNQEDQIRELKQIVNDARGDLERTAKTASDSLAKGMDGAVEQVKDVADSAKQNREKIEELTRAAKETSTSGPLYEQKLAEADAIEGKQGEDKSDGSQSAQS